MSTDPSGQSPPQPSLGPQQQNGGSSISSASLTGTSCENVVTDPVLLREVAEIANKVRELEKSVPCQLNNALDSNNQQPSGTGGGQIQQDTQPTGEFGNRNSNVIVHTMSATSVDTVGGGSGGDCAVTQDEAQQPSERLIIKLNSNKSSGCGGDNMKSDPVAGRSKTGKNNNSGGSMEDSDNILCPTMNEVEIKALVKELKRKIEYTERMNWLCKYPLTQYRQPATTNPRPPVS